MSPYTTDYGGASDIIMAILAEDVCRRTAFSAGGLGAAERRATAFGVRD